MYSTGRMNQATRKKHHGTNLIYRCNSNAILQTSSAGLPIWQRFRGLIPGPLLSQIPPQQPDAITFHCGIMAQYIRSHNGQCKIYWCGLWSQWAMFYSSVNNLFLTSIMLWFLATIKYDELWPNLFSIIYSNVSGIYQKHGVISSMNLVSDCIKSIFRTSIWGYTYIKPGATFKY